jgi:heme oxygenase
VHEALVRHTRAAHRALHVHPDLARLMAPGLDAAHYARVLAAQAAFLAAVEARRARLRVHPDLALGEALDALARDLGPDAERDLGRPPVDLDEGSTGPLPRLPWLADGPSTLGALYVLHGQRFGAAHISARVAAHLPRAPRAFLELPADGAAWARLLAEVEALGADDRARGALLDSAARTFEAFGDWVARSLARGSAGLRGSSGPRGSTGLRGSSGA